MPSCIECDRETYDGVHAVVRSTLDIHCPVLDAVIWSLPLICFLETAAHVRKQVSSHDGEIRQTMLSALEMAYIMELADTLVRVGSLHYYGYMQSAMSVIVLVPWKSEFSRPCSCRSIVIMLRRC